jgi:hypothetical protein
LKTSVTSLKRKREIDEDADLYGEEAQLTDKKPRGDNTEHEPRNVSDVDFARDGEKDTVAEHLEWLVFLVTQEGGLRVSPFVTNI